MKTETRIQESEFRIDMLVGIVPGVLILSPEFCLLNF